MHHAMHYAMRRAMHRVRRNAHPVKAGYSEAKTESIDAQRAQLSRSLAASMKANLLGAGVRSHGHLTLPPSRNGGTLAKAGHCGGGECAWFSQGVDAAGSFIPAGLEPTLNEPRWRTMNVAVSGGPADYSRRMPWRAPGRAAVLGSGCGVAGGGPTKLAANGGDATHWHLVQNTDALSLPELAVAPGGGNRTVWRRGAAARVAFALASNHGGGYSFRLCKNDSAGGVSVRRAA